MSGMIVVPASLRSDFIHMAGMTIHIALESTIHIAGIRTLTDEMEKLQRKNAASTKSCAMPTSSSTSKKSGALLGHPLPDEDLDKES